MLDFEDFAIIGCAVIFVLCLAVTLIAQALGFVAVFKTAAAVLFILLPLPVAVTVFFMLFDLIKDILGGCK